jgi:rRNA maturation protein Nop10
MQLKKCPKCSIYTLGQTCPKCKKPTKETTYKYKEIRDAPKDSSSHFSKIRNQIPKEERIKKYQS